MDNNTIRRAMAGDREAQEVCTQAGTILPCPFCGAEPEIAKLHVPQVGGGARAIHHAMCLACGCSKSDYGVYEEHDVIASWNTRAEPPTVAENERVGWVACRERLPEMPNGWVLVVEADDSGDYEYGHWDFVFPAYWRDGAFHHVCADRQFHNVTHWMPMPGLPETAD